MPSSTKERSLFVFLPSTAAKPSDYQLIQQEAVDLGYYVVGLAYPNADAVVHICNLKATYYEREACNLNMRLETLDGKNDSPDTNVDKWNSIENRLTALLKYLATTYPEEGWQGFVDEGGPNWSRLVVAGHSQGGGNA